jgi:hypothetical protein
MFSRILRCSYGGKANQNKDGETDGAELSEIPPIGHPYATAKPAATFASIGKCIVMTFMQELSHSKLCVCWLSQMLTNAHEFSRKRAHTDFWAEKLRNVSDSCRKQSCRMKSGPRSVLCNRKQEEIDIMKACEDQKED